MPLGEREADRNEQQPRAPKRPALRPSDSEEELEIPDWLKNMDADKINIRKIKRARHEGVAVPNQDEQAALVDPLVHQRQALVPQGLLPPQKSEKKSKKHKKSRKHKKSSKKRRRSSSSSSSRSASSSEGSTSHSANAVFREATRTRSRSSQENLIRYARQNPGRLACAAMQSWDKLSAKTGRTYKYAKTSMPPCATRFFLNVLKPKEGDKGTGRLREIEVLSHVMDALATNKIAEASDILAQRMLACKIAEEDGSWNRAQFAELIPADSINMVSRELRQMTQREEAAQKRASKSSSSNDGWINTENDPSKKGKGDPWFVTKGGKNYKKGWILQGKGGKPWKDFSQGKNQDHGKNAQWDKKRKY